MLNFILLQASGASAQAQQGMGSYSGIIMIVLMIAIFYFFMIRPQNNKQKKIQQFRNGLQKGDKVITAGGIHGRVRNINESTMVIEIAEGVKITVDTAQIYPGNENAAGNVPK